MAVFESCVLGFWKTVEVLETTEMLKMVVEQCLWRQCPRHLKGAGGGTVGSLESPFSRPV